MTNPAGVQELLDYAIVCAMRYRWGYPGYETLDKTSIALRRKCKGTNKLQRQTILEKALLLNKEAEERAKKLAVENKNLNPNELMSSEYWKEEVGELRHQHPLFSKSAINNALSWGLYWGVLR